MTARPWILLAAALFWVWPVVEYRQAGLTCALAVMGIEIIVGIAGLIGWVCGGKVRG